MTVDNVKQKFIPYGRQDISQEDIDAVCHVLQSDWLTQGPAISTFEQQLCDYTGAKFACAVSNGTAALHLACLALGLGEGDWLWTTPNTFVASANCALYCGAKVDFVDIDPQTYNMSLQQLKDKLVTADKNGTLPKVVVPVHFAGQACDMKEIKQLADRYGFAVIEDASHAIGGRYLDQAIGNCQYSDMTVFSFHPVKIVTTAEGGAIMTNNPELATKLEYLRTHGITRRQDLMTTQNEGGWYYEQLALGYNYRITDMQCALGSVQLKRIDHYVQKRNQLADNYHQLLAKHPLVLPTVLENNYSAYHLYVVQVDEEHAAKDRRAVFEYLRDCNIGVNVHYIPVHIQPYYKDNFGFNRGDFPVAESYYKQAITLPLYPGLTTEDQNYISESLTQILS